MSEREMHDWTIERLSDHVEGGLSGSEREAVEHHLDACAVCREVRSDLEQVALAAHALGAIEPPTDLWPGIRDRIAAKASGGDVDESGVTPLGIVPLDAVRRAGGGAGRGMGTAPVTPPAPDRFASRPLLAAAAVVLIAMSASLAWWGRGVVGDPPSMAAIDPPTPPASVRAATAEPAGPVSEALASELERLESVIADSRDRLEPGTVHVLERNLVLIERAIEDSYRALALDPENDFVRDHLERTYERKLEYLREIASIVERAG